MDPAHVIAFLRNVKPTVTGYTTNTGGQVVPVPKQPTVDQAATANSIAMQPVAPKGNSGGRR